MKEYNQPHYLSQDGMVTIAEFAQLTNKSYSRIHSLSVDRGVIRTIQAGNGTKNSPKWLIPVSEIENFIETPRYMGRPRKGDRINNSSGRGDN